MTMVGSWPRHNVSGTTATVGVTKTQLFFQQTAKWLFREQPLEDYGIDAHVEIVESGDVKGRLVALQIKSGDSWLKKDASGGWNFYPESHHVIYWQNHSLPVAVVVWQESTDTLFIREASRHTFQRTKGGGWKLRFTEEDVLTKSKLPSLELLSSGTTYDLRLRELRLLLPWMQRMDEGQRIVLKADEWVNKTWGKGDLSIIAIDQGGVEQEIGRWMVAFGLRPYEQALPALFQWADLRMNPDVEWEMDEEFEVDFEEDDERIGPYSNSAGEVDRWSLELHLNEIGRAFMSLDKYARTGRYKQLAP